MNKLKILFLFTMLLGVSQKLFSQGVDINKACLPITLEFSAPTGTSYFWDFKDGATSSLQNPQHLYTQAGVYNVTLNNGVGGPSIGTITVTILPELVADFITDKTKSCPPAAIIFNDKTNYPSGVTPTDHIWVFGDGKFANALSSTTNIYGIGLFSPALTVKTNTPGCSATIQKDDFIEVFKKPKTEIIASPDGSCNLPVIVSFSSSVVGEGPFQYQWTFPGNIIETTEIPLVKTFNIKGSYNILLKVTDKNGCSFDTFKIIQAGDIFIKPIIKSPCFPNEMEVTSQAPAGTHKWEFSPDASKPISFSRKTLLTFAGPGIKTVKYTWTSVDKSCTKDTTFTFRYEGDIYKIVSDYAFDCDGPILISYSVPDSLGLLGNFSWISPKYFTSNNPNPSFTYKKDTNNYSIYFDRFIATFLMLESKAGCKYEYTKLDTIVYTVAAFEVDSYKLCVPDTFCFKDLSGSSGKIIEWIWDFGDGNTQTITNAPNGNTCYAYSKPGVYEVTLFIKDEKGCTDGSYQIKLKVCGMDSDTTNGGGSCTPIGGKDIVICYGDSIQFNYSFGSPFLEGGKLITDNSYYFHHYLNSDSFNLTNPFYVPYTHLIGKEFITNEAMTVNGDFLIDTVGEITVKGAKAVASYMTNCVNRKTVMFKSKSINATNLLWQFPDGTSSTADSLNHSFTSTGDYLVKLTAWNAIDGCPPDYDSVLVSIRDLKANIGLLKDEYCVGDTIKLDGINSTDVNNKCYKGYTWIFSREHRPLTTGMAVAQIIFQEPGPVDLILEVTDINGCLDSAFTNFTVHKVTAIMASIPDIVCAPKDIILTDQSTSITDPIVSWFWEVKDIMVSDLKNLVYTITTSTPNGKLYITHTVETKIGCRSSVIDSILIYTPISAIFVDPDAILCENEQVVFSAQDYVTQGSSLNFNWDFGNGNGSILQQANTKYSQSGLYQVKLIYTEKSSGCTDSLFKNITVLEAPDASFTTDAQGKLCYPKSIFFTNTTTPLAGNTYLWDDGNGNTNNQVNPAFTFQKGTYIVKLIASNSQGCPDSASQSFTFIGPEGTIAFDKSSICLYDELTFSLKDTSEIGSWEWDFGDGVIIKGGSPVKHTYTFLPPSGQTTAKLKLIDPSGDCEVTVEVPVPIIQTKAAFNIDGQSLCFGSNISLINTSEFADSYSWTIGNQAPTSVFEPNFNVTQTGTLAITLIASNLQVGCKDTITLIFQLGSLAPLEVFGDTICLGDTATIGVLNPDSSFTYLWTPSSTLTTPNQAITNATPIITTTYTLNYIDSLGCDGLVQAIVVVDNGSGLDQLIIDTVKINSLVTINLPGTDGFIFEWTPSGLLSCSTCPNPSFTATQDTIIFATVSDPNGCGEGTIEIRFIVASEEVKIPNVFTPNGDGKNDVFEVWTGIVGTKGIGQLRMKIWDRWGNLIYENLDSSKRNWDGTYKDKPCPSDVYVYGIDVVFFDGKIKNYRGDITLIR